MKRLIAQPHFRRFALAEIVSEFGTWLAYVALAVVVYDDTHSATWVSILLILDTVPAIAAGVALAPLLDRLDRKRVLVGAELAGGVLFLLLAATNGLPALLVLAFLAGCAASLTRPALSAALPYLVAESDLEAANGLRQTIRSAAILTGPPLAGVLVAFGGGRSAFALNGVSFLVSALLLARIPAGSIQNDDDRRAAVAEGDHLRALMRGIHVFRTRPLRALLAGWTIASLAWGAVNVAEVLIAKQLFHAGDTGFGILAAASGAGMLLGSLLLPRIGRHAAPLTSYALAVGLAAVGLGVLVAAPWFPLAVCCFVVMGAGNCASIGALRLVVQQECKPAALGRAFGLVNASGMTVSLIGLGSAGAIVSLVGVRGLVAATALAAAAAAVTVLVISGEARERRPISRGGRPVVDAG